MNHLKLNLWLTAVVSLIAAATLSGNGQDLSAGQSAVSTTGGLTTVTFATDAGKLKLYLPEDLAAGDTISGTVSTEPNGKDANEKIANLGVLNGMVIDLGDGTRVNASQPTFSWVPKIPSGTLPSKFLIRLIDVIGNDGKTIASTKVTFVSPTAAATNFNFPNIAQTVRPARITGPFDGDASNTRLTIGGKPIEIIAESPRQTIMRTPAGITGITDLTVNEHGKQGSAPIRIVGVNLSAPKTNLLKGEKTTVTIHVTGLEGIKTIVPLEIVTNGTVNMQGGNIQNIRIEPGQVSSNGTYTKSLGLTGTSAGNFNVTGTVLVGNPATGENGCKCVCEFADPPIVTAGNGRKKGVAWYSFEPNMKNTACNGNQCTVNRIEYSWSVGAGSTATYTVRGNDKASKTLTVDITKTGTVELSVTVMVVCSDGSKCSATGAKTFTLKS